MSFFSVSYERDWAFYLNSRTVFTFCGKPDKDLATKIKPDFSSGSSAKLCFKELDSRGVVLGCSEPELLLEVLRTKAAINWQIKQWSEMLVGGIMFPSELAECRSSFHLPNWVLDATISQAVKLGWPKPWATFTRTLLDGLGGK